MSNLTRKQVFKDPILLLAFGLGSGLSPKMPGTIGTLVAVLLYFPMAQLPFPFHLVLVVIFFVCGVFICDYAEKKVGKTDHPGIVFDEWVGFWLAAAWIPVTWSYVLATFILFRIFDIFKPWPINRLDKKCKGGLGIMVDDIVAGLYTMGVVMLAQTILVHA